MTLPFPIVGALRDAGWLDAARARTYRLVLLAVTLVVFAAWLAASRHGIDRFGKPIGTDFLAFWSASRLALSGTPAAAYDLARIAAVERAAMPVDPGVSSFLYPPPFLLLCWPLALLPYFAALPVWLGLGFAGYAAAVRAWLGARRGWIVTLLAFPAIVTNIGHGQNGFLTAALLGALVVKPQLAFAIPVLVRAGGRWRTAVAGAATAAVLSLAALAAFGPGVWHGFLAGSAIGRAILEQGLVEPGKMVSAFAAIRVLHGGMAAGYAVQALVAGAAAIALAVVCRRDAVPGGQAATAAAATVLMSPFLLDYDLTAIAFPLAWLFGEGLRRGFRPWEKLVLAAGYLLPLFARDLALGIGVPVAPAVLGALVWITARAARSDHRHPAVDVQRLAGDIPRLA